MKRRGTIIRMIDAFLSIQRIKTEEEQEERESGGK
jgi:hypothetical protein